MRWVTIMDRHIVDKEITGHFGQRRPGYCQLLSAAMARLRVEAPRNSVKDAVEYLGARGRIRWSCNMRVSTMRVSLTFLTSCTECKSVFTCEGGRSPELLSVEYLEMVDYDPKVAASAAASVGFARRAEPPF